MASFILPIVFFILSLTHKLFRNFRMWKKNQSVNHTKEGKYYAVMVLSTSGILLTALSGNIPLAIVPVILMLFFWFLTLFDGLYNLLRRWYRKKKGEPFGHYTFFYTGTNDVDDAVTDNFLQRMKTWQVIIFKIGGIAFFTTLYIIIYSKYAYR